MRAARGTNFHNERTVLPASAPATGAYSLQIWLGVSSSSRSGLSGDWNVRIE